MTSASRNAMRKYVSKELGTLRRELNCTMEEMASCLNISPRSYYALEKGEPVQRAGADPAGESDPRPGTQAPIHEPAANADGSI